LEERREEARKLGPDGHPLRAFFFNDAFTECKGETPHFKSLTAKSKSMDKISNRIVGIEVVCGTIDAIFLYHLDQFVSGGSNTLIEVQRQAMSDLAELLKSQRHPFPRTVNYQFDNCGENKVSFHYFFQSFTID
jgi:hypothetical protein